MPQVPEDAWETITGLPDDEDAWVAKPRFGYKEEYKARIDIGGADKEAGLMLLLDLVNEDGETIATQGYSVGGGWIPQDGGKRISHPTRKAIVKTSVYGQLIDRVTKVLKVPMHKRGSPLEAESWEGIGFHWKQEGHKTVGGEQKTALMPIQMLSDKAPKKATVSVASPDLEAVLSGIAKTSSQTDFRKKALKTPGVTDNDELMSQIVDGSEKGYWATHQ